MMENESYITRATPLPRALGPYSLSVRVENLVFTSGQLGVDAITGDLATGIEAQTRQALLNLQSILEIEGTDLNRVVKTTVFLQDLAHFEQVNAVYGEFFADPKPARSTVQAAALPRGALIEIDCIAIAVPPRGRIKKS